MRKIAITIDDLPLAEYKSREWGADDQRIAERYVGIIQKRKLPVTGFVVFSAANKAENVMSIWQMAHIDIGNHTWSHLKLSEVSIEQYLEDLERGHKAAARMATHQTLIPFRYPYLNPGRNELEQKMIMSRLTTLGSQVAPATIVTDDWKLCRDFTGAKRKGNDEKQRSLVQNALFSYEEGTLISECLSRALYEREPAQILLIHANELNLEVIETFLDWLQGRNYKIITLIEALTDPAYKDGFQGVLSFGTTHWHNVYRARRTKEITMSKT